MAANVLNSEQAVRLSVFVVRAFVRMRELLTGSKELAAELKKLEAKLTARLDVHETAIVDVLRRIMQLLRSPPQGHPLLSLFTSFRGHALRHDHLRTAVLRARSPARPTRAGKIHGLPYDDETTTQGLGSGPSRPGLFALIVSAGLSSSSPPWPRRRASRDTSRGWP